MKHSKLFMILLGCKPPGRHTEQHDVFFCIEKSMKDVVPHIHSFWKEAGTIHVDGWREVNHVGGFAVHIHLRTEAPASSQNAKLFFLNLGGYKQEEFEEYHYKMIVASPDKGTAIKRAKETAFYKHTGFKGATSHIDDKYGIDVDDVYEITDILPAGIKEKYSMHLTPDDAVMEDELHLGYFKLDKF
jgi:hypothetical protein